MKEYIEYLKACQKRRESVLLLYNSGLSASQIGRQLGLTRQRIHQMLHENPDFVKRPPKKQRPTSASLPDD